VKKLIPALLILSLLLTGCFSPQRFRPFDIPPPLPECQVPERIRLALVLGGGGAKGIAHIGVLREFEEANIPIDLIIGCSAGSMVGALYSDHPDADYLYSIVEPMNRRNLLDINIFSARYGLCSGNFLKKHLQRHLSVRKFHELKIPFLLVATDLHSGELVTIGGGDITPAVQASCAIPFVFVPVQLHGRVLVDGGVIDPVPVRVARDLGAELIIAVDVRGLLHPTLPTNLFGVATRSAEITLLWQSEGCIQDADVIIRPEVAHIGCFEDASHKIIYEAGRTAARQAIPQIKELLSCLPSSSEIKEN
jgi:NTE family protein